MTESFIRNFQSTYTPEGLWKFHNPVSVHFGRGIRAQLGDSLEEKRCLIVCSARGRIQFESDSVLLPILLRNQVTWIDTVRENPSVEDIQYCINDHKNNSPDCIVAFGGGSAIDTAKVLALTLAGTNQNRNIRSLLSEPRLYAEIDPIPLFAVPTTAGTGSEVTPFATVWDHKSKKKHSISGKSIFPQAAFVDPQLTDNLPANVTLSTGLDAFNQAAESIWNRNANPITIAYGTRAFQLAFYALPRLLSGRADVRERDQMSEASLLAGLAISHTKTALCHSISYPITAHFGVPHGLACAFSMVPVLDRSLLNDDGRFTALADSLFGVNDADMLKAAVKEFNKSLNVRDKVASKVGEVEQLLSIKEEMFTKDRAGNAIIDEIDIDEILIEAWNSD